MRNFNDFYNTIDDIYEHMRTDFIGPVEADEMLKYEEPIERYSLGILFAQPNKNSNESIFRESNEELFEDNSEDDEKALNINIFKPSSFAVSFSVDSEAVLDIIFDYAIYRLIEEDSVKYYKREPHSFSVTAKVPDKIINIPLSDSEQFFSLMLHVRRINNDGSKLVTVSVTNKNTLENEYIEASTKSLFQCQLRIKSDSGFKPIYQNNRIKSSEEEKSNMLYDSDHNYSYGHGCSSVSVESKGIVTEIKSDFLPKYRMLQMMPRLIDDAEYLNMIYWEDTKREVACLKLIEFVSQYEEWFSELKNNNELIRKYPIPAESSFRNIQNCIDRLYNGIGVLMKDDKAWEAFRFMNEAMLLQRIKTKHCPPESVSWYPFQLAYIIQIIPDIVDSNSPFHNDVDLLWFPTGGGKTEAYLGLSAFTIFYRRLTGNGNSFTDGVAVIMRYTLRLLTIQQFERASALVCACEYMRRKYNISGGEISIGLWIGSSMTPNHTEEAIQTLEKLKQDSTISLYEANPMQVTKCPWCGAEISVGGYDTSQKFMNIHCCNNSECDFHNHLPLYLIDDDIYKFKPTFLLSTVDKFARITWEERAGNLLGSDGNKPPELIIQDELHLISGPLGSITGIYELAIDEICKHNGQSPKIIASTATVKNADKQIKILYNRNMIQFPPNGLSHKDSFFAVEASQEQRPARTYIGICSIGSGSTSELYIKIFALLIFLKHLYIKQKKPTDIIDQFYTSVGYFNSLKELGTSSIIITDRIYNEIKYLTYYKFKKEAQACDLKVDVKDSDILQYFQSEELTSRNTSKEIKNVLDRLSLKFTDNGCFDYILASNMLSVGIDIDRLGVMCVYGQPKANAEYIQATSRVGRTNPGLVVTLYSGLRSRDKSYYEQFSYYHSTFYKYVESTSVTSYSPRAIEKALHAAFMAIIRHTIPRYNPNSGASIFKRDDKEIEQIKQTILKRVSDIEPRIVWFAEEYLDFYLDCWAELSKSRKNSLVFYNYSDENMSLFRSADNNKGSDIPSILNSVRNVESTSDIYFTKR